MSETYTIENPLISANGTYTPLSLQLVGSEIVAMGNGLTPEGVRVDGTHRLALPGFVNAHTHSSELWFRGLIPPLPLELWLAELYDFEPLEPEQIYLSALGTAVETLLSGGTTVVDHLVPIPGKEIESIAAAVRGYRDVGIRAFIGPLLQDEPMEAGVPTGKGHVSVSPAQRNTQVMLDVLDEAVQTFHAPLDGIHIMAAPTGAQLCSDRFLEGCVELSDRHSLCRHTHLLESKAQKILAQEKYRCTAVEHLKRLSFLGDRTSLAHCIWLDDVDIQHLADTRSTVVHNPLSNLRLGSGIAPLLKYRQAGINVTFGCDGAASNDSQDVLEAIKIGTLLHNTTDYDYRHWITPQDAVRMASQGGATGLGLGDRLGSLEVGKRADVVLYDLTSLSLLPRTDPIGLLVMGRPTQVVDSVWVNGKRVVAQGQVTTVDVDALVQELFSRSQWCQAAGQFPNGKASPTPSHSAIEAQYRFVMGLSELQE